MQFVLVGSALNLCPEHQVLLSTAHPTVEK